MRNKKEEKSSEDARENSKTFFTHRLDIYIFVCASIRSSNKVFRGEFMRHVVNKERINMQKDERRTQSEAGVVVVVFHSHLMSSHSSAFAGGGMGEKTKQNNTEEKQAAREEAINETSTLLEIGRILPLVSEIH